MEMPQYDAHFGAVHVRPDTARGVRESAARALAAAGPWLWLAERDGVTVGMVQAEVREAASWIAGRGRQQPVAYLGQMSVLPGRRGRASEPRWSSTCTGKSTGSALPSRFCVTLSSTRYPRRSGTGWVTVRCGRSGKRGRPPT
jgi:hypothetical protein